MFNLIPETKPDLNPNDPSIEGTSDGHPITCYDSPEGFRALCWLLYANPKEIYAQQNPCTVNITTLSQIASLAHKYEFATFEEWALTVLRDLPDDSYTPVPLNQLDDLLFISFQCKSDVLVQKVQRILIERILRDADPVLSLSLVLRIAERVDDRHFQAKAYYAFLKKTSFTLSSRPSRLGVENIASDNPFPRLPLSGLSEVQRLRLHCGYQSLLTIRGQLTEYPDLGKCRITGCEDQWREWWKAKSSIVGAWTTASNDPGRVLEWMLQEIQSAHIHCSSPSRRGGVFSSLRLTCKLARLQRLKELKEKFEESLPGCFVV